MIKKQLSRRAFLGFGATAAVVAGAGLAGCAPKAAESNESSLSATGSGNVADVTWEKEVDVVVVGYGGAGSAAAIEAKEAGAEVLLLEETKNPGGSTLACGGFIMMGGTKLQEKFGIEDSVENFYKYLVAAAGENANEEAIRVVADASPDLYDWCVKCGMDFESGECDVDHHLGGYNAGYSLGYSANEQARDFAKIATPAPHGHLAQPGSSGKDIFAALSATVEKLGIEVMTNTPCRSLVKDDSGRVCGVIVENEGKEMAVKARKAVVMTAGGFGNNETMVDDFYPFLNRRGTSIVSAGNENGSGILMGQAIGADTHAMSCFQIGATVSTLGDALAHCVIVDSNARRIVAEDEYNSFIGKAVIMAPTSECYLIIDDAHAQEGSASKSYGEPLATVDALDQIAGAIGMNVDVLKSTLDFYNESANLGEDREYGKAKKYLSPLEEGPFHVFSFGSEKCYTASCGGLKIDTDAHVIDLNGAPIPGLYAAGRNAGTIYGWYIGSGSSMADVLTFGRIAGKNAAAEKPQSA